MRFVSSTGGFFSLRFARSRGFALIVTLMMMLLLALLAVGLLNLSSVTLRSTGASSAQVDARANARLALELAIGDLQRHAGGDMKITAPADLIDAANPPLLGVWKSWEGSNHVDSGNLRGRPTAPDYGSKTDRFVSWLVSSVQENPSQIDAATLVSRTPSPDTVPMVATGSVAEGDDREVHVTPHAVGNGGAYAWWISGENQKARIPEPPATDGLTAADWADRNRNHQVADPEPFHLNAVLADRSLASRVPTLSTADIIAGEGAPEKPRQNFHDLSANSVGLLTNVATGGWRKDFSLLTENWDAQPTTGPITATAG